MPINNANKDGAWELWGRSASKGLWECKEGKLISTETRRVLGRGRNKYDTLFYSHNIRRKDF